jgi:hypothetical protein
MVDRRTFLEHPSSIASAALVVPSMQTSPRFAVNAMQSAADGMAYVKKYFEQIAAVIIRL